MKLFETVEHFENIKKLIGFLKALLKFRQFKLACNCSILLYFRVVGKTNYSRHYNGGILKTIIDKHVLTLNLLYDLKNCQTPIKNDARWTDKLNSSYNTF